MICIPSVRIEAAALRRAPGYRKFLAEKGQVRADSLCLSAEDFRAAIRDFSPAFGPGTELKKLLGWIGIRATPRCRCAARARLMDRNGPDWCERNLETIVGWLEEEAVRRKLPFSHTIARRAVVHSIRRARRLQSA